MKIQVSLALLSLCGTVQGFSSSSLRTAHMIRPLVSTKPSKVIVYSTAEEKKTKDVTSNDEGPASKFLDDPNAPDLLGEPIPYSALTIGVLKETFPGENRVSQTPDSVHALVKEGFTVVVESGGKENK
jgi:H+-translocating NAD(P) transhydrogenase